MGKRARAWEAGGFHTDCPSCSTSCTWASILPKPRFSIYKSASQGSCKNYVSTK